MEWGLIDCLCVTLTALITLAVCVICLADCQRDVDELEGDMS